jgi:FtsH-binding integral membrane protein
MMFRGLQETKRANASPMLNKQMHYFDPLVQ